jgi:chromate transporter
MQRFDLATAAWVHGLQLVAVAVVAQAVWGMARQFLTDRLRVAIGIGTTLVLLFVPSSVGQVSVILVAGLLGWRLLPPASSGFHPHVGIPISHRFGLTSWVVFLLFLLGLPLLGLIGSVDQDGALALFEGFYRSGALVFGGGHVVLPLLQAVVVPRGWIENNAFLAGYGAAQAVPGPLFTFAAFLGAARGPSPNGVLGAAVGLVAIFLPGALLVYASLPFWNTFRQHTAFQRALSGINASVVGILLAALYLTIWSPTVREASDFGVVVVAFALLTIWKRAPWQVVVLGALAGAAIGWLR